jgi:predicted RNA binding protein YcfA (HicA-like mRNA interferase family)
MSGLPAIKYRGLYRFIRSLDYELQRVDGSHERYYLKSHIGGDGNLTIVKTHGEIPRGTLLNILKDISVHTGIPVARLKEMINAY